MNKMTRSVQELVHGVAVVKGQMDWKGVTPHAKLEDEATGVITDLVVRDLRIANVYIWPEKATAEREELLAAIEADQTLLKMLGNPDTSGYMALGGYFGTQDTALGLLALGEFLGFWSLYTPRVVFGADAVTDEMEYNGIGMGYLSTDGRLEKDVKHLN
jgi:hypothetical protein